MTGRVAWTPQPGTPLTDPEIRVLECVARGLSNEATAAEVGLSVHTVKSHLQRVGRKLGNRDRAGIVGEAYRTGVLRAEERVKVPVPDELARLMVTLARMALDGRNIAGLRPAALKVVRWSAALAEQRERAVRR